MSSDNPAWAIRKGFFWIVEYFAVALVVSRGQVSGSDGYSDGH